MEIVANLFLIDAETGLKSSSKEALTLSETNEAGNGRG